jgi:hypothetical protein
MGTTKHVARAITLITFKSYRKIKQSELYDGAWEVSLDIMRVYCVYCVYCVYYVYCVSTIEIFHSFPFFN